MSTTPIIQTIDLRKVYGMGEIMVPALDGVSITIEAAELMERFQWLNEEQSRELLNDSSERDQVVDELADIFLYCISFINIFEVDMSNAILDKLERNKKRYPIGYMPTQE